MSCFIRAHLAACCWWKWGVKLPQNQNNVWTQEHLDVQTENLDRSGFLSRINSRSLENLVLIYCLSEDVHKITRSLSDSSYIIYKKCLFVLSACILFIMLTVVHHEPNILQTNSNPVMMVTYSTQYLVIMLMSLVEEQSSLSVPFVLPALSVLMKLQYKYIQKN